MCKETRSLVCDLKVTDGQLSWEIPSENIDKWSALIRQAIEAERLEPREAASIAGKLNFGAQQAWGREGRPYMYPLIKRQYGTSTKLSKTLRGALEGWIRFLKSERRRVIECRDDMDNAEVIIYTDAEGAGGLGALAHFREKNEWVACMTKTPETWRRKWRWR